MEKIVSSVFLLMAILLLWNLNCVQTYKLSRAEIACLKAHNMYRRRHGKRPLRWDSRLASSAKSYAKRLAAMGVLRHASGNFGENLAYAYSSRGVSNLGAEAVERWYKEICRYRSCSFSSGTGHFTQLIWKASKRLGCAVYKKGNQVFTVARYYPPGNYGGKYRENVGCPNTRSIVLNERKTCRWGSRGYVM